MFNLFRRKSLSEGAPELLALRTALFAMDDLESLVGGLTADNLAVSPWSYFASAYAQLKAKKKDAAIAELRQALAIPGLETRIYLLAWHNLRTLGVMPLAAQSHQVRGVIIEAPLKDGREILAAYADHRARYFNFSGRSLIWEEQDETIGGLIDGLLSSTRPILKKAQPWKKPEPGPPAPGLTRISILTDFGLHFGQGPQKMLAKDALGGQPLKAAAALRQALLERATQIIAVWANDPASRLKSVKIMTNSLE